MNSEYSAYMMDRITPSQNYSLKNKSTILFRIILGLFLFVVFFVPSAFAQSVSFSSSSYTLSDGAVGSSIIITVTNSTANLNPAAFDTVSITITSTTDPSGITLILSETGINTGIFQNTNLIFTTGDAQYKITDTVTITITDSSQNVNLSAIDTTTVDVTSTSDPSGIILTLSETNISSGVFKGTLAFTSSSSSGNTILVADGNIVSVTYPLNGEIANGLIVPNPNAGVGSIKAAVGDTITATYFGLTDTATITTSGPGSGSGGPVRPGLVLDAILGLGGCSRDCSPPTLGISRWGQRLVDNGFSYNGNPVDVEQYFTPYPLITVQVGEQNVATLKIFENGGIQNIRHVELGFGLGKGEVISESKAVIEYDINFDGTTQTKLFDPNMALDNVTVTTKPTNCELEDEEEKCLEVSFHHTFRESLEFNMVGTNVWDHRRNGWQNYFNEGIEIKGDSLNPPKQIQVLDRLGYPKIITLIDKKLGVDKDGNIWNKDGNFWKNEYTPPTRDDPVTMHGIDRNNNKFEKYKLEQTEKAMTIFQDIVLNQEINNPDFGKNYHSQIILNQISRWEDPTLQQKIIDEIKRASLIVKTKFPQIYQDFS